MQPPVLLATNGVGLVRAEVGAGDTWTVTQPRLPLRPHAVAASPQSRGVAFAGTNAGIWRSTDFGKTWSLTGLVDRNVRAIAASSCERGLVFAGTRRPALFVSRDDGLSWHELPALRRLARLRAFFSPAEWPPLPYVSAIALPCADPRRIVVGFEVGGVAATDDGGETWRVGKGAIYDCHSLSSHPTDGLRFYEGGAGWKKAGRVSRDGGFTWTGPAAIDGNDYGWASAGHPGKPDTWYYAASSSPFKAHTPGKAAATLYRVDGDRVVATPGLPSGLAGMPYQVITSGESMLCGLSTGEVWTSAGESWRQLPVNLGRIERTMAALPV